MKPAARNSIAPAVDFEEGSLLGMLDESTRNPAQVNVDHHTEADAEDNKTPSDLLSVIKMAKRFAQQNVQLSEDELKAQRVEARKKFDPSNFELDKSKEYMQALSLQVVLDSLYTLVDTCNDNKNSLFNPVLLKINNEIFLQQFSMSPEGEVFPYLLQIWSNDGLLVFERRLRKPPAQWALAGKNFLLREDDQADVLLVLKIRQNRPAQLYTVKLPFSEVARAQNKADASKAMIGFANGHILFMLDNLIFYADVSESLSDKSLKNIEKELEKSQLDENSLCREFQVDCDAFKFISVSKEYKPLDFLEVTDGANAKDEKEQIAVILERISDHKLIFLKINIEKQNDCMNVGLINLGDYGKQFTESANSDSSEIKKWFTVQNSNAKGLAQNLAVVLRKDGSTDFYCNFILVERNTNVLVEDINYDFNFVYLAVQKDGKCGTYKIRQSWRDRVGMSVAELKMFDEEKKHQKNWQSIISKRVSYYMRLYQSQMNFENFFVVAHRKYVSTYHVANQSWEHFSFDDKVMYLGQTIRPKEKSVSLLWFAQEKTQSFTDKYEVAVFVGSSQVRFLALDNNTKTLALQFERAFSIPGTFVRYVRDEEKHHGVSVLTSNQAPRKYLINTDFCTRFSSLSSINNTKETKFSLEFLTEGKLWPLLSPADKEANEMLSNKCRFFQYVDFWYKDGEIDNFDKGERTHPTEFRKILGLFNPVNGKFKAYHIEFARILNKPKNNNKFAVTWEGCKIADPDFELDLSEHVNESTSVKGLFKILVADQAYTDQFLIATDEKFLVFGADKKLKFIYKGYNIGSVMQADQYFLYGINEAEYEHSVRDEENETVVNDLFFRSPGLYIYDLEYLLKGQVQSYKLASALSGGVFELQFSNFNRSLCFFQNITNVMVSPYVHRNTIDFKGIKQKNNYLIWREKGGYFTCMDKWGQIATWSIATGSLMYKFECQNFAKNFESCSPYAADKDDNSYHRNRMNFNHKTIQLIKCKAPLATPISNKPPMDQVITCPASTNDVKITQEGKPCQIYKFYVIEMFGHEECSAEKDTIEFQRQLADVGKMERDEEVQIALEFDFEVLGKLTDEQYARQGWSAYKKPTQHLYVSSDKTKLLEIVNRKTVNIYKACNQEMTLAGHKKVQWKREQVVDRFSNLLQGEATVNFLFSKNFNYYFDFEFDSNQLFINDTATQQHFVAIPNDMLNFDNMDGLKRKVSVSAIGKNVSFYFGGQEMWIRIINTDGVDCIFEFDKQGLKLVSYAKIDNYNLMKAVHNIAEDAQMSKKSILSRLIRRQQRYKTNLIHQITSKRKQFQYALKDARANTVDYSYVGWDGTNATFVAELSFTILNWKILEKVLSRESFDLMSVDNAQLIQLVYCIFPKNQTVMHKFCAMKDPKVSPYMPEGVQTLFDVARSGEVFGDKDFEPGLKFDVPFLIDAFGCTPIDLALGVSSRISDEEVGKSDNNFIDTELTSVYLKNLKDQPFLNFGNLIIRSIELCILSEVQGLGEFLDSRLKKVICMPSKVQYQLKDEVTNSCKGDLEYGVATTGPMISDIELKKKAYQKSGWNFQYYNYMYDLPFLHLHTPEGVAFIQALGSQSDVNLFSHKSIEIIVKYQWEQWKSFVYYMKMIPYGILLLCFLFWSNMVVEHSHQHVTEEGLPIDEGDLKYRKADIALCWILIACTSFFMITEIEQLVSAPLVYISGWTTNFTDLVPLLLLYTNTIWSITNPGPLATSFWVIQSLTSIMILLKFVWFLRSQDLFAYLIQSLVEAIKDIRPFFVILIITCIGFSDAFLSLSRSLGKDGFVGNFYESFRYTWLYVLGQNPEIENMNTFADIIYFIASIYLLIILLNVLIAIAGNALGNAQESKDEHALAAKIELLSELMSHPVVRLKARFSDVKKSNSENLLFISFKRDIIEKEEDTC